MKLVFGDLVLKNIYTGLLLKMGYFKGINLILLEMTILYANKNDEIGVEPKSFSVVFLGLWTNSVIRKESWKDEAASEFLVLSCLGDVESEAKKVFLLLKH